MKKGILITLAVIVGVVLNGHCIGGWLQNQFVTADEGIKNSWAQVENVMQRRADLIPNLVANGKRLRQTRKSRFLFKCRSAGQVGGAKTIQKRSPPISRSMASCLGSW